MSEWIALLNDVSVTLYGVVLSAAFCGAATRRNVRIFWGCMAGFTVLQAVVYARWDAAFMRDIYPLAVHLPLFLVLAALTRRPLWSVICVLSAYLCCQLRHWIGLFTAALLSGGTMLQDAVKLVITIPLLLLLLRFAAPAVRQLSAYPVRTQLLFATIPALYYAFDYMTVVYTDLLASGAPVAVEFMPFVCCVAYLFFLLSYSAQERRRGELEQVQKSLNLQLTQSVREIGALRESQELASRYRHDLRHHLQYVAACIENGETGHAREYIEGICGEIEAQKVERYCENETVNLILSAFAGRGAREGVRMEVEGALPDEVRIADSDLCVLLSNALENALHACRPLAGEGTECTVTVMVYDREGRIFLQVSNPFRGEVRFRDGVPVTDKPGHGLGVESICAVVRRYGGVYTFLTEGGRFILRLSV